MRRLQVDTNVNRLTYVRYVNNFLFCYIGSKSDAVKLLIHISHFTDQFLGMKLHTKKSNVKHHERGVIFLGYRI